jgi:hypothetical protein
VACLPVELAAKLPQRPHEPLEIVCVRFAAWNKLEFGREHPRALRHLDEYRAFD